MLVSDSNVFLMKDYSDEELIDIAESLSDAQKTIIISRKVALNPSMIDKICKHFKATDVRVSIPIGNTSSSTIFDERETEVLKLNFAKLQENHFRALFIEGEDEEEYQGYTLEETLSASKKISHWAREINSAVVGGRALSPLEKFVYAYDLVTKFIHNKGRDETSPMDSRNLVKILNGDKIVCIGYASMLAELCKRVDIPCLVQLVIDGEGEKEGYNTINHASCKVYINDPIYNYEGIVNADASKDAFKRGYGQTICHMMLTDKEIKEIFDGKVKFAGESWFYSETINEFMNEVSERSEGMIYSAPEFSFKIKDMNGEIERILINVFSKNERIFDAIAKGQVKNLEATSKDLEETYYPSIYAGIYSVAICQGDEYLESELEKLLYRTLMVSNLSVDDLFAELLDFGNRYLPDEETLQKLLFQAEETQARENYAEIVKMSSKTEPIDPLMVFEALANVYSSRTQNEDFAVYKANSIFDNSTRFAMNKWSLLENSGNYFMEEALRLKKDYEASAAPKMAAKAVF